MSHLRPARFSWIACLCMLVLSSAALAQTPLHQRIDQHIQKGLKGDPAQRSSDEEFLRRVYLNLTGVIPSIEEARAFLADKTADNRVKLVDNLLAGDGYTRHMTNLFDVLLMDRRPDKHVQRPQWRDFLQTSFAKNKPYDLLVREILSADGSDPKTRPAAKFYLDRDAEPNVLTKDVSRLFLGMNLHCAQCHDHPLVDAYKQDFYYGLLAFLNRGYLFADKGSKTSIYAEKAEGDVTFQSVFVAKVTKSTGPRLPDGKELKDPKFDKGQEYVKPVGKGERGIPKYSRRAQLADQIASKDNPRFARAAVNRLWYFMMGRGIVEPVEYDHPANPPSHPELLQMLSEEFVASKYDVKSLVRAIVLTDTYQRTSELPKGKEVDPKTFAAASLKPVTPEQFAWSMMQATGLIAAERKAQGAKPNDAAIYAKLAGQVPPFVALFGTQPGDAAFSQDFEATLDQTLFLANGATLRDWLGTRAGSLIDRANLQKDAGLATEEMYLSVLTRLPTAEERKEVVDYLKRREANRLTALQDLAWALLTSAEFRFNH
ncbi:MAG: DUF1553 domain-containing protein [Gemmataceae bacterium]|nr:DUF1553 domain-containing protein [Gemmataceae bacterium]